MTSKRIVASYVTMQCLMVLTLAVPSAAEPPRAPGANTGDGSSPFTGLAQSPDANLNVGASRTSIPIEVPPGRKALTPKLALTYSSAGGPSPYGYGWDLPLGKIQRNTKHGVPRCGPSPYQNDFVLLLPEATLECLLDAGNRCNATVEESFLRIQYKPAPDNKWEAWDKSGLHYVFGDVQAARAPVYPDPGCATFTWMLTHIDDPNGNTLDITYNTYALSGFGLTGVSYPNTIRYGGHSANPSLAHKFEVAFVWIDRPAGDQVVNSIGGFPAKLTKLLSRIEVRYPVGGTPVRSYKFDYEFQTSAPDRVARQSFLSAVTLFDRNNSALSRADGSAVQTTFLYHQNDPNASAGNRFGFSPTAQNAVWPPLPAPTGMGRYTVIGGGYATTVRDILDMNGDGIPDLVDAQSCASGSWNVYLGTNHGFSTTPISWHVGLGLCALRQVASWNPPYSFTLYDTFDINGDGIPDWVNRPLYGVWSVLLGHAGTNATSGWGFDDIPKSNWVDNPPGPANPNYWPFPETGLYDNLRYSEGGVTVAGQSGTVDHQDFIDINGDGLLDIVRDDPAGWRVWFNIGKGFDNGAGTVFSAPASFLRFTTDSGSQLIGVYDVNADGLADQILAYSNSWQVYLNSGRGLGAMETWVGPASACGNAGLRQTLYTDHTDVARDFFDINGDGLPDVVDACGWSTTNKYWKVYLNRGDGFSPQAYSWWSPSGLIRDVDDHAQNTGGKSYQDAFDIDGDGALDFIDFRSSPYRIYHSADGAWAVDGTGTGVVENAVSARADVLEQMENGLGGTTYLDYRPSTQWNNADTNGIPRLPFPIWTVTHIEQDDGLCDDNGANCLTQGSHSVSTDIRYYFGLYEPTAREFRGFGAVEEYDHDGDKRTTWFRQDAARKGKVYKTVDATPGNNPLVYTFAYWNCVDPVTQAPMDCPQVIPSGQRRWVRLPEVDRYDTTNYVMSAVSITQNLQWDAYGNITQTQKGGSNTATATTYGEYAYRDDGISYIVDKPIHLWVSDGVSKLEEKWFAYDVSGLGSVIKGNLTSIYSWLDQVIDSRLPAGDPCPPPSSAKCVTTQIAYDYFGNVTSVVDGNGNLTTTTYDGSVSIYPYQATRVGANQEVATSYDPACGKLLWQTVNYAGGQTPTAQKRTEYTYDTFCRPFNVTTPYPGPNNGITQQQTQFYTYYLGKPWQGSSAATPTEVVITHLVAGDPNTIASLVWAVRGEFFDALGRHLQTQHSAVVDGNSTYVAEDSVKFDARGNVTTRYAPFQTGWAFNPNSPSGTGVTTYAYDALNRVTQVTNPDGTWHTIDYSVAWQTTSKDECYTAGTCPGTRSVEIVDAFGRVVEKQLYMGNATSEAFETRTGFAYDGMGRLKATKQGKTATSWQLSGPDTTVTNTYDSLGRKIMTIDPDTGPSTGPGTWKYGYDRAGNLIFQDDPKAGQRVEFCYDTINRVLGKYYRSDAAPNLVNCATEPKDYTKDITYRYDEGGGYNLGRLTSVIDPSNPSGNPPAPAAVFTYDVRGRMTSMQKTISANGTAPTVTISYTYDVADHPLTIRYPAAQGESSGELVTYAYDNVGQAKTVVGSSTYLSNLTYDIFGRPRMITHGNGTTDARTYYDKTQNFRLASIQTSQQGVSSPALNLSYAQYWANGLLRQLNDGRDSASPAQPAILSNNATYTYDGLGRLTQASGTNLPAPNTYAYTDHLGNLTLKEGTTFPYSTVKPHQLTVSGALHDNNGNRSAKTNQTYTYNGDDRLTQVVLTAGGNVGFVYDYAGRQVARIAGTTATRYFSELVESSSDGYLTKHYFAAGLRIASRRVYAPLLAALPADPAVQLAQGAGAHPALVLVLRHDAQRGVLLCVAILGAGVLVAPWRRKRVVGIAVRHGHVIGIIVVLGITTLPLPIVVKPAAAQTPPALYHWHLDHLGSTQAVTDSSGAVVEYIRYKPYGAIRGRYNSSGGSVATQYRYEFTGYESEATSGLEYAGARFYDPALAAFLTHDPVRQFANPYTYTNWNPTNRTDPTGAFDPVLLAIIVGVTAGFAASAIQAAVNGASFGEALQAGAQGALIGGVTAFVGAGIVAPALQSTTAVVARQIAEAGMANAAEWAKLAVYGTAFAGSLGQASYGLSQGDYSGIIGLGIGFGLTVGLTQGGNGAGGRLSQQEQLDLSANYFDQRFQAPFQRGLWSSVCYLGRIFAHDLEAAAVGVVGKPIVLAEDLWAVGQSVAALDPGSISTNVMNTIFDTIVPTYGFYGGAGWGTRQFGDIGIPSPLNRVDWASFQHDMRFRHLEWVRNVWSPGTLGLPPGPIGLAYAVIGTPPFALAGALQ